MLKYKENRKLVTFICDNCGCEATKPESEYKRNLRFRHNKDIPVASRASLDRIDSTKGYIIGNVQFISTPINYLKNTMTDLETKQYLKLISQYTSNFH